MTFYSASSDLLERVKTMSRLPKMTTSQKRGNFGVSLVSGILTISFEWIFRQQPQDDFGIDAHVEVVEKDGGVTGRLLALQIKYGKKYTKQKNEDGYIIKGHLSQLNYFFNYSIPVLFVIGCPDTKGFYWQIMSSRNVKRINTGWSMLVPFNQPLDTSMKDELYWIAQPALDYAQDLEMEWEMNNAIESIGLFAYNVTDIEILDEDISQAVNFIQRMSTSKEIAQKAHNKLDVFISGYNSDPRELYEIREVRIWIRHLVEMCPNILYFLSPAAGIFPVIIASYCKYTKTEEGIMLNQTDLDSFLNFYLGRLSSYAKEIGHSSEEVEEMEKVITSRIR